MKIYNLEDPQKYVMLRFLPDCMKRNISTAITIYVQEKQFFLIVLDTSNICNVK